MFSLICVWINGWVNNREAGDLGRHRAHYYVIVMIDSRLTHRMYCPHRLHTYLIYPCHIQSPGTLSEVFGMTWRIRRRLYLNCTTSCFGSCYYLEIRTYTASAEYGLLEIWNFTKYLQFSNTIFLSMNIFEVDTQEQCWGLQHFTWSLSVKYAYKEYFSCMNNVCNSANITISNVLVAINLFLYDQPITHLMWYQVAHDSTKRLHSDINTKSIRIYENWVSTQNRNPQSWLQTLLVRKRECLEKRQYTIIFDLLIH